MVLGIGLQLLLGLLFDRIRNRFEDHCWGLIEADPSTSIGGGMEAVLARQVNGGDDRTAAAEARRSQRFNKRLEVLIDLAWPPQRR